MPLKQLPLVMVLLAASLGSAKHDHAVSAKGLSQGKFQSPAARAAALYRLPMVKAFAALSKLAYCGPGPMKPWLSGPRYGDAEEMPKVVGASCGPYCEEAGFRLGTTLLVSRGYHGQKNADFAFVSQLESTQKGRPPFAQCIISFRGTWVSPANNKVNGNTSLVEFQTPSCPSGCKVVGGPYAMWNRMEPDILKQLDALGCKTGSTIALTGHSLGAQLASIGMFFLSEKGYDIALSFTFEQPKPFNKKAVEVFEQVLTKHRPVSFFRVTHTNDKVVTYPGHSSIYQPGFQVWYESSTSDAKYKLCGTQLEAPTCGSLGIPKDQLCNMQGGNPEWLMCGGSAPMGGPHCISPVAPALNFCSMAGSSQVSINFLTSYSATCLMGNALANEAVFPTSSPGAWPIPPNKTKAGHPTTPSLLVGAPAPAPPPVRMPPLHKSPKKVPGAKSKSMPGHVDCFQNDTYATPLGMYGHMVSQEESAFACQKRCQQTAYCEMFSFYSWKSMQLPGGTCEITGGWGDYAPGMAGSVAGPKSCRKSRPRLSQAEKTALYANYMQYVASQLNPQLTMGYEKKTGGSMGLGVPKRLSLGRVLCLSLTMLVAGACASLAAVRATGLLVGVRGARGARGAGSPMAALMSAQEHDLERLVE